MQVDQGVSQLLLPGHCCFFHDSAALSTTDLRKTPATTWPSTTWIAPDGRDFRALVIVALDDLVSWLAAKSPANSRKGAVIRTSFVPVPH